MLKESSSFKSIFEPVPVEQVLAMGLKPLPKLHPEYPSGYMRSKTSGNVSMAGGTWGIVSSRIWDWYPNLETGAYQYRLQEILAGRDPDAPKLKLVLKPKHTPEKPASKPPTATSSSPKLVIKHKTETRNVEVQHPARKPIFKLGKNRGV